MKTSSQILRWCGILEARMCITKYYIAVLPYLSLQSYLLIIFFLLLFFCFCFYFIDLFCSFRIKNIFIRITCIWMAKAKSMILYKIVFPFPFHYLSLSLYTPIYTPLCSKSFPSISVYV